MDRYTVIYTAKYTKSEDIKKIMDAFATKEDTYGSYSIGNTLVNIKGGRLVAKNMLREDIADFTKTIRNMGIYTYPHEYIGKKFINSIERSHLLENIKNEKYFVHSNTIDKENTMLIFTNPAKLGSAYGMLKKDYILIFANRLQLIDSIYNSIYRTCDNLHENNRSRVILCI